MSPSRERPSVFESYPDQGFEAYSVVLGAWLALFPASGLLNSTGIFQAWLLVNQLDNYSEAQIAWIFSVFAFLFFFGGIQAGPLFDRYGLKYLLPTGACGLVISLVCTSFCTEYYQFMLAFACLGGISSSIIWTISIATLGQWFMQNRGLATGLATTAGGIGGLCYPLAFSRLSHRIGFPWTMRCFALITLLCFMGSLPLLKTRLPANTASRVVLNWKGFRDVRFTITMSAIFILDWAVLVPPAYITTYASFHGHNEIATNILAILNSASTFGRGLPGFVADKFGRFNVMIACSILSALSIFGLWLHAGSNAPILLSFAVAYGLFSGSAYSLTPVCVAQLCRTEEYATRYGTAYGVVSFATLAGVPISGNILGTGDSNNYIALVLFCGTAYAMSAILFILAKGISQDWKFFTIF
ncbi:MFS monocarboxylate transporter-like protein [Fusarium tricinctum]|uniref:MFS monocarboxylate transporter-like protein n=2 Tax=Fusarium tricinctum species complex TaxID=679429 RepID=A0A8K0RPB9_9HYPO|nr:MFS monocarboxylate transporter-like protein [Fusarium tricinctum]